MPQALEGVHLQWGDESVLHAGFWLADGPTIQREFALNVVILMRPSKGLIPRETLSTWMSAFWTVYQDDWDKLDRYRTAKYLQLAYGFMVESLELMKTSKWDLALMAEVHSVWMHVGPFKVLTSSLMKTAPGLTFAMADKYIDLLSTVAQGEVLDAQTSLELTRPFLEFVSSFKLDATVQQWVHEKVLQKITLFVDPKPVAEKLFLLAALQRANSAQKDMLYASVAHYDAYMESCGVAPDYEAVYEEAQKELKRRAEALAKKVAHKKPRPAIEKVEQPRKKKQRKAKSKTKQSKGKKVSQR